MKLKKQERFNRIVSKEPMLLTAQDPKFAPNPKQALMLIQAVVNPDPDERPAITEVLSHSMFTKLSTLLGKPRGKIHYYCAD
jgi:hypothetical protein